MGFLRHGRPARGGRTLGGRVNRAKRRMGGRGGPGWFVACCVWANMVRSRCLAPAAGHVLPPPWGFLHGCSRCRRPLVRIHAKMFCQSRLGRFRLFLTIIPTTPGLCFVFRRATTTRLPQRRPASEQVVSWCGCQACFVSRASGVCSETVFCASGVLQVVFV